MPGVRLHHPTLRSVVLTVEVPWRAYRQLFNCPTCQVTHRFKTYHLQLDHEGDVIVSETVLERLKEVGRIPGTKPFAGLLILNEVSNPPAQTLGMGGPVPSTRIVPSELDYQLER